MAKIKKKEIKSAHSNSYIHKDSKDFKLQLAKAVKHLSQNDKIMQEIIKNAGACGIKPHKKYFETLVKSIVSQQLSVKAAASIFKRFKDLFGAKNFPSPEAIIAMPDDRLRGCGLSYPKAGYLKDLSVKVLDGTVKINKMGRLTDEEIINELIQVKGIGVWSAHMFLLFCLGRLNVYPVGDLGIRNAVVKNYNLRKHPDEKKMRVISKKNKWEPYHSVAAWYLWASLKNK